MADYRIILEAETARAEKDLRRIETVADTAARNRKLHIEIPSIGQVQKSVEGLKNSVDGAANNVRQFYQVSKVIPGIGEKVEKVEQAFNGTGSAIRGAMDVINRNSSVGEILGNGLESAARAGGALLNGLSKVGFALFGLKEIVGVVQGAFGELFNQTIGREIQLRQTLLKTQTTVASMSDVFVGGKQIVDPLEKIKALTGSVEKNVDNIRERSLELAGVTSNEVVEVFGIVAGQIGQIGGDLKDAEDLAISFAAALGTFQIPLQQARQEITSMMQGNIGADSYLARALGITNSDIQKARTQAGGIVEFIQKKLETAVAGQKLAAQSFSGVMSNLQELGELIGQRLGRGLLDPMLAGLTQIYKSTSAIKDQLYAMADGAGITLGRILKIASVRISTAITAGTSFATDTGALKALKDTGDAAQRIANNVFNTLNSLATTTVASIIQVFNALRPSIALVAEAFGRLIKAFAELQVGQFQTLVSAVANLATVVATVATPLAGFFNIWSRILDLPIFQYMSEVAVVLGLLKRAGLDAALTFVSLSGFIMGTAVPAIVKIGIAVGGFIGVLGLLVVSLAKVALSIAAMAGAFLTPAAAIPALQAGLLQFIASMRAAGAAAAQTGTQLNTLAAGMKGLGASAKSMGMSLAASLGAFALIQIGIAVLVDLFGRYQRAQQAAADGGKIAASLAFIERNAKGASGGLDTVNQALYDYSAALVNAERANLQKQLAEVNMELLGNQKLLKSGKSGLEGWWHSFLYGAAATKAKIGELTVEQNRILDLIKRIDAAQKQANAENARAYANSPKGKIEQLQKEEKIRMSLAAIQLDETKNSIQLQLLHGKTTEAYAQQATALAGINNISGEIQAKQTLMSQIKMIDPSNTEEITKLRGEIAQLDGKKIQIELQLKKEAFDKAVAELNSANTARIGALDVEAKLLQNNLTLTQAMASAESARLDFVMQNLQFAKESAKSDSERLRIAEEINKVQKAQADATYKAALAAIYAGIRQLGIEAKKAEYQYQLLKAIVQTARAQGQYNDAHGEALKAAKQALNIAVDNYKTTVKASEYQKKVAEWTRKSAYAAADNALNMERTAKNTEKAAQSASRFADSLQKAYGIQLQGFSQLEPWMERKVAEAKKQAIANNLSADSYASYVAGVNAEIEVRSSFEKIISAEQQANDTKSEQEFWKKADTLGYSKFASGGYVTRPTMGLVGEGGESEYIIPESKMGAASASYLGGSRGASVLGSTESLAFGKRREPTINIKTGPVLEFNGQRYVTMGDFERGLRATATSVFGALRTPAGRYAMGVR